jgi:hypothetical protein
MRELSQELISLESSNQELSQYKKIADERRAKVLDL